MNTIEAELPSELSSPHGNTRHGLTGSPLYQYWANMLQRCENPKHPNYDCYGGRGISVWEPWRTDPAAFIAWVLSTLGPRPEGNTPGGRARWSLDRIDNDKGYTPGNLRWADTLLQQQNRRSTKLTLETAREIRELAATGEYTMRALAEKYGVTASAVQGVTSYRTWRNAGGPEPRWTRTRVRVSPLTSADVA